MGTRYPGSRPKSFRAFSEGQGFVRSYQADLAVGASVRPSNFTPPRGGFSAESTPTEGVRFHAPPPPRRTLFGKNLIEFDLPVPCQTTPSGSSERAATARSGIPPRWWSCFRAHSPRFDGSRSQRRTLRRGGGPPVNPAGPQQYDALAQDHREESRGWDREVPHAGHVRPSFPNCSVRPETRTASPPARPDTGYTDSSQGFCLRVERHARRLSEGTVTFASSAKRFRSITAISARRLRKFALQINDPFRETGPLGPFNAQVMQQDRLRPVGAHHNTGFAPGDRRWWIPPRPCLRPA
jgi:hypothetical protein